VDDVETLLNSIGTSVDIVREKAETHLNGDDADIVSSNLFCIAEDIRMIAQYLGKPELEAKFEERVDNW